MMTIESVRLKHDYFEKLDADVVDIPYGVRHDVLKFRGNLFNDYFF